MEEHVWGHCRADTLIVQGYLCDLHIGVSVLMGPKPGRGANLSIILFPRLCFMSSIGLKYQCKLPTTIQEREGGLNHLLTVRIVETSGRSANNTELMF